MSGRLEHDKKIEEKIKLKLIDQPQLIRDYANSFGNKTASTKKIYINYVIDFVEFLKREYDLDITVIKNVKKLNYSHINTYMNYIKNHMPDGTVVEKTAGTCAMEFYSIKHFCKYLYRCRYIRYNPCEDVEVPKDNTLHEIVSLTPEEIQKIKDNIANGVGTSRSQAYMKKWKSRDLCIILLGISTGLRVTAIANVDIKDIDFDEKMLHTIEKGNVERVVCLSDKMIDIIKLWMVDREKILGDTQCDALFISWYRERIGGSTIRDILNRYTYNINKNITPHKLRSTAATNLYEKTGDIYLVADVLGHRNLKNTMRYAKVSNDKRKYAAEKLSDLI